MNLPNIFTAYSSIHELNNQFDLPVFNSKGVNEEIKLADRELLDNIIKFNELVANLINKLSSDDIEIIQGLLIKLRIQSMTLLTIFDCLSDD